MIDLDAVDDAIDAFLVGILADVGLGNVEALLLFFVEDRRLLDLGMLLGDSEDLFKNESSCGSPISPELLRPPCVVRSVMN